MRLSLVDLILVVPDHSTAIYCLAQAVYRNVHIVLSAEDPFSADNSNKIGSLVSNNGVGWYGNLVYDGCTSQT